MVVSVSAFIRLLVLRHSDAGSFIRASGKAPLSSLPGIVAANQGANLPSVRPRV
nr:MULTISPECIES: hypothetical protein [Laceyella]